MKILVTGSNGFVGSFLVRQLVEKGYDVMATGRGDCRLPFRDEVYFQYAALDFTDPFAVHELLESYKPDIIIHTAAMSKPDECEENQELAYRINVEGTLTLLFNAEEFRCFFLFVSTDFIFDGTAESYDETSLPGPVNFYGMTKLEAENYVQGYKYEWAIARTALVYGKPLSGRSNLLTIVNEKLMKGEEYPVVNDQVRTPTYVEDLAAGLVTIIEKRATGIFHLSGKDILTPYEIAIKVADHLYLNSSLIRKVTAANFKQPAKRPFKTVFVIDKARQQLGWQPVSFDEGLRRTFA